jgi:hypothetical protein
LNEAQPLLERDLIAITLKVVGLELSMLMEVHKHPLPKATTLLLGTGNGIGTNVQPSIAYHEVLLVGVGISPVAVPGRLRCGQQGLIEHRLPVDVACRSMLGLDVGDGAVLIVGLVASCIFGNGYGG